MKITIVTVTFNSAKTIRDTLESIKNQTYPNIEHIIVDGASSDNTLEIVRQYNHVAKIISEPDNGIYDAMNKGLKIATGDIIGILNSDDFYLSPKTISEVVNVFKKQATDTVYGDLQYVDANKIDKIVRTWISGKFNKNNFYKGWMPPHPTFFVRKEIYTKFGYFNLKLTMAADYEIMLRFLFKNNVSTYYLPQTIVKMRAGGVSNSNLRNRLKANSEDKRAWEVNNIDPKFYTFILKPVLKIKQYFI